MLRVPSLYGIYVFLLCFMNLVSGADQTLQVVNVIFRHGDRAPTTKLPKDRANETFWANGYGELTQIGEQQHYRLGKLLRQHYGDFLSMAFKSDEIYVRSSDYDRCLISAYSNLAGLYSNSSDPSHDLQLPFMYWQPVPVHSTPVEVDQILAMDKPCTLVSDSQNDLFSSSIVDEINKDYAEFFKFLSQKTGIDFQGNAFRNMWKIHDSLFCESKHGLALPDWTQMKNVTCSGSKVIPCSGKTVWDILVEMADFQFFVMYNSTIMHKFDGGPLLEDIAINIRDFNAGQRKVKYNVYSGHDTTVSAVLSALGVFDDKAPQYTATVLIELHKEGKDQVIKVFYKNVTDDDAIHQLTLPGCQASCPLDKFMDMLKKYKIEDWDKECGNIPKKNHSSILTEEEIIVISVCSCLVLILAFAALICYTRRKRISQSYVPMT